MSVHMMPGGLDNPAFKSVFRLAADKCGSAGHGFNYDLALSPDGGEHRVEIANALNAARGLAPVSETQAALYREDVRAFTGYVNTSLELGMRSGPA